jgi:hypothetical protein
MANLGEAWTKKGYTAAAHFGKTNFGRKAAKSGRAPNQGPKNRHGVEPLFFGICRETFHSEHTKNQ